MEHWSIKQGTRYTLSYGSIDIHSCCVGSKVKSQIGSILLFLILAKTRVSLENMSPLLPQGEQLKKTAILLLWQASFPPRNKTLKPWCRTIEKEHKRQHFQIGDNLTTAQQASKMLDEKNWIKLSHDQHMNSTKHLAFMLYM